MILLHKLLSYKGPYLNYVYTERGRGLPNADVVREVAWILYHGSDNKRAMALETRELS